MYLLNVRLCSDYGERNAKSSNAVERTPFFIVWTVIWERNGKGRFWLSRTENSAFLEQILAFLFPGDALRYCRRTIQTTESRCVLSQVIIESLRPPTNANRLLAQFSGVFGCVLWFVVWTPFQRTLFILQRSSAIHPPFYSVSNFCVAFSVVWTPLRSFWHSLNTPPNFETGIDSAWNRSRSS